MQIWISIATYLINAILHKLLKPPGALYRTMQLLSIRPFEKDYVNALPMKTAHKTVVSHDSNPMNLFPL